MPSVPDKQNLSHEAEETAANTGDAAVRRATDALAEIESLERLIDLAESHSPDESPVTEHPAVRAISSRPAISTSPCIACHGSEAHRLYSIDGVQEELVKCEGCGLGSLHPMPDSARIQSFYPAEYYGEPTAKFEPLVEAGVRFGARMRVRSLIGDLPTGSKVLDVGCGRGVMLRALLDLGHEAHGVEIAPEAASGADPRAQIRIAPELSEAGYDDNTFDAVILWHVLEHLPQPDKTLNEISRILRPGGRLVLAVPNFASWQSRYSAQDWFHLDLPRHLYHFTPDTIQRLLACSGFQCDSVRHLAMLQNSFGWLQSLLNRTTDTPRNSLYSLLHRGGEHPVLHDLPRLQRLTLKLGYWAGLPVAALITLLEAMAGSGGTIAVTASQVPLGTPQSVVNATVPQPAAVSV